MCCSLLCKQFFLLLWKNFVLQIRRPIGTVFELILPLLAVLFIVVLRRSGLFPSDNRIFSTFEPDHLTVPDSPPLGLSQYSIFYTPPEAGTIVERAVDLMGVDSVSTQPFNSEAEMVANLTDLEQSVISGCFVRGAGVVFTNLGSNVEYTIRLRHEVGDQNSWLTRVLSPTFELPGPRIDPNSYLVEGFLHLQNVLGQAIIENKTGQTLNLEVAVEQFPYPGYKTDIFLETIGGFLPLLLVMAYLFSAGVLVKELVLEKETRIRETMLMMGLKQWILWSTWYLKQFLFLLITVILITILVKIGGVFAASNILLVFIYFLLFLLSMISFGFLVSVWFNSSRVGLIVGFVVWFANYLPFLFLQPRFQDLPLGGKVASCILSNTCMGLGVEVISRLEQRLVGIRFDNLFQPLSADDSFNMAWVMGMLLLDSIVYMVLAWYINGVKPGTYGVPKPFYFPFLPSYWTGKARRSKIEEARGLVEDIGQYDSSAHEEVPGNLDVGISIRNLTKIYDQSIFSKLISNRKKEAPRTKAVSNLNLNLYKGQITALLGHNGAGKTTTMSILTGLYTPTSGSATINGFDILTDMDQVRRSLGICPQHNILFDRLTVSEHLSFFLRLKGIFDSTRVRTEVDTMIEDLQLLDKKKVQSKNLSGGMKRKLSVAIALIGGSEIVILDEPTSGMDPYARRATWDLLVKYKTGKTVLLTTHFMDEADLLGDRIAIMAEGVLRCSGSSLFLKSRYGVGYHLTLVKDTSCVSSRVEQLVKSFVPEAEQVTDVGAELSFILPSSSTPAFPNLFDRLEADKAALGIQSFGVSVTTMEEVFMKVGEGTDETLDDRLRRGGTLSPTSTLSPNHHLSPSHQAPDQTGKQTDVAVEHGEDGEVQVAKIDFSKEEGGDSPLPGQIPPSPTTEEPETTFKGGSQTNTDEDRIQLQEETGLNYSYIPNRGIVLWFQQFYAMFMKRIHNFKRFYGAVVTQLILPLVFILFSMIVAVTTPSNSSDDPIRILHINNSALSSENMTVFTAMFGQLRLTDSDTFDFSDLDARDLGATNLFDYTDSVQGIMNQTRDNLPSSNADCCRYENQILDQFCASRPVQDLMSTCRDTENFGYNDFDQNCISCCQSTVSRDVLRSCSNPFFLTYPSSPSRSRLCPSPPKLSYTAASASQPAGLLQSQNVYIAELLLRTAQEETPDVFFRRFQAGFSLTVREPPHSVCGCTQTEDVCTNSPYISALTTDPTSTGNISRYSFNQPCALAWSFFARDFNCSTAFLGINTIPGCKDLNFSFTGPELQCNRSLSRPSNAYRVDGLSSDLLQFGTCGNLTQCDDFVLDREPACPPQQRTVAAVYPDEGAEPSIAATVWYNNQPYHMPAAALSAFHNALLKKLRPSDGLSIAVSNHPLPRNVTIQAQDALNDPSGFGVGILVVFGFSFLLASFVLFLVKEKESKAKHIQYVSGVRTSTYWLSTFAWDLLNALGPIIVSIILFAAFQVEAYSTVEALAAIFLLLLLTSWASIPITYIVSFAFSNSLTAYSLLMIFFFFSSMLLLTVVFVVSLTESDDSNVADVLHYIFLIFPTYGLSAGFNDLFINQNVKNFCQRPGTEQICAGPNLNFVNNPLDIRRPGIGIIYIYMFVEGLIFFILTVLIQERFFIPKLCGIMKRNRNSYVPSTEPLLAGEDNDVHAERKRVLSGSTDDTDVVIIKNLVKIYSGHLSGCAWKPAKPAVRGISLGIPGGECFGLLGVNGAGKTTTFNILTGDLSMTSGTGVIAGYDIRTNLRDVQQSIGYCPQFDALLERLTGRELLTMFARLRGVPERQIKEVVEVEITRLDLRKHAHKKCGTYSGGNKRKLSTAIALVGNPPIVLLDEPTTGMDPTTRRYLWDVLTGIVQEGRSIVLTSHSMEECEALCTRLAIMVNGSFKCLGSIQHLKNKFGSGLSLQAKVMMSPPPEEFTRSGSRRERRSLRRILSGGSQPQVPSPSHNSVTSPVHGEVVVNPSAVTKPSMTLSGGVMSPARSLFDPYDTTSLHIFIREAFPGAILLEEHQGAVTYQLPTNAMSWSSVFRQLESNKERLGIVDYSVSQTTLEQVFINFAKEQFEE